MIGLVPPALRILYCDDQARFLDEFRGRHVHEFRVDEVQDVAEVLRVLDRGKRLPDLLLLDLYHPRPSADGDELRHVAEERLADLAVAIDAARPAVEAAYAPRAIELLEAVRARYSARQLPVLIYTRRGLLMLRGEDIRKITELEGDWLIKDSERIDGDTESLVIRAFVRRLKDQPRLQRDIVLGTVFTLAGGLLGTITTLVIG